MFFRLVILFLFISYSSVYAKDSQESIDSQNSHDYDDSEAAENSQLTAATTTSTCKDLIDCTLYQQYCNVPAYLSNMCKNCQQTCGFCTPLNQAKCSAASEPSQSTSTTNTIIPTTNTTTCKDLINCTIYQRYCDVPAYLDLLCKDCQQTCNLCGSIGQAVCAQDVGTPPPCKDLIDCSQNAQDCSIPAYRSVMCQDCRATCGLCGSKYNDECVAPSNDPTCVDNTDCSGYLSLCSSPSTKQTMCSQCKKSCKFCAPSTYCD